MASTAEWKFNLGDRVKDRISGLQGIAVSRSQHLFGCSKYWVSPEETKDGKPADGAWVDEDALELVDAGAIRPRVYRLVDAADVPAGARSDTGGPMGQPRPATGPRGR